MSSELKFHCDAPNCTSVEVAAKSPTTEPPKEWLRVEIETANDVLPLGDGHKNTRAHACSMACVKRIIYQSLSDIPDGRTIVATQVYTFRLVHKEDQQ